MTSKWVDRTVGRVCVFGSALLMTILTASTLAVTAWAGGVSTTVSDLVGDTVEISGPGSTPAYLDIVGASVTRTDGGFEFSTDLAVAVPEKPLLAHGAREYWWAWWLDTDLTTFPTGFPRTPGMHVAPEFALWVAWNGDQFTAFIVDRRPTLTGGESVITPVGFSVNDARVSAFVDAEIIDDPASFAFRAGTRTYRGLPGTEGYVNSDGAPNAAPGTAAYFVAWPS